MHTLRFTTQIDAPADAVFRWHEQPGAFERLVPPWEEVELKKFDGIRDGQRAVLKLGVGPLTLKWVAEHREYVAGERFQDVQVKGPFKAWTHTHHVRDAGEATASLEDHLEYVLPFGDLGRRVGARAVRRRIERQFAYRHRVMRHDVPAHLRYGGKPLRIAVSGASGAIGSALTPFLTAGGHEVVPIVRTEPEDPEAAIFWNDREMKIDAARLEGFDAVIHLAGEKVLEPVWSDQKKMQIHASRVRSTELLAGTLAGLERPPGVFVCASAVGYYGNRGDEVLTEASPPGDDGFLSAVTQDWETAATTAAEAGIRTVMLRLGAVLTPRSAPLSTMLTPFRLGLGGCYGRRDQFVSWIAIDDVLHATYHILNTESIEGPVNVTAPRPVTMETFARTLGRVLSRPTFVRVPAPMIQLLYGEAADEAILQSARVHPERLEASGYDFLYPDLEDALRHLLGR